MFEDGVALVYFERHFSPNRCGQSRRATKGEARAQNLRDDAERKFCSRVFRIPPNCRGWRRGSDDSGRALDILAAGATAVIAGSALFKGGQPDIEFARRMADAIGADRFIAAVDSKGGQVVVNGWKTSLQVTAVDAVRALEPYCGEFLYTHVDAEGLMQGTNIPAILDVRRATSRRVTAAGGITTQEEIDALDANGVDSVVGMAVYTGKLRVNAPGD
jgi:phosphoribosylformimino-5-aminoimidazole carboxamide ribonucleotide (ProFAR) isomerase